VLIREKQEVAAVKAFLVSMIFSRLLLPPFLPLPHFPFLCLRFHCSFPLLQHFPHLPLDLVEFETDYFERRLHAESMQDFSKELDVLCSSSSSPPLSGFRLLSSYLQLSSFPLSLLPRPPSAS